ncbi:hypothetical protein [Pseudomonas syringae]|uniref:hypothetical protein n=1 Tax=Pseudomonas syringae TaxID=317 RepID=UPI00200B79BA|nr:hypothetical protein [Pseudomonas syringae]MCK9709872.1 hypothetical protein [Pseudomonas syringae pv. syringae]
MKTKVRKANHSLPTADLPIDWPRADPAALIAFNPATKTCTMNCGPHALDPRSREERKLLCNDCVPYQPSAQEQLRESLAREDALRAELDALRTQQEEKTK